MWPCDAAGTTYLINVGDLNFVKAQSALAPSGYLRGDVNLTGATNVGDVNLTKAISTIPKTADL